MSTGTPHFWTEAEDLFLRKFYAAHGTRYCAAALTLSYHVVRARARDLGLYSDCRRHRGNQAESEPRLRGWGWA